MDIIWIAHQICAILIYVYYRIVYYAIVIHNAYNVIMDSHLQVKILVKNNYAMLKIVSIVNKVNKHNVLYK